MGSKKIYKDILSYHSAVFIFSIPHPSGLHEILIILAVTSYSADRTLSKHIFVKNSRRDSMPDDS